ncbi:unnamed protein product [Calypogeia fissa]
MGRWDLESDEDEKDSNVVTHVVAQIQDGQGSHMDDDDHDLHMFEKHAISRSGSESKLGVGDLSLGVNHPELSKSEDEILNVEWDISTPNVRPPHEDWPINAKELEILMPKVEFFKFAKLIFDDPLLWATKSWEQEKFTISKVTHQGVASHWQQRFREYAPNKGNARQTSVYPPFLRCLIAEFVLNWKVDYKWEDSHGKVTHVVHESVQAIAKNRNRGNGKDFSIGTSKKGSKRSIHGTVKVHTQGKERTGVIPGFFVKAECAPPPTNVESSKAKRPNTSGVGSSQPLASNIVVLDSTKESFNMHNLCKSLGADVGDFIEKSLHTKFGVELCELTTLAKYKSKLQEAEMKISLLEKRIIESATTFEVKEYKVQLYDNMEEIRRLTQQLAEKDGQCNQVAELEENNRIINSLRQELASQQVIVSTLNDDIQQINVGDGLGSGSNSEKLEVLDENIAHMHFIDPSGQSKLFPDVEVEPDVLEKYFDKWRNDETMAPFVREKNGRYYCSVVDGKNGKYMLQPTSQQLTSKICNDLFVAIDDVNNNLK